jgi:hypothetical protein
MRSGVLSGVDVSAMAAEHKKPPAEAVIIILRIFESVIILIFQFTDVLNKTTGSQLHTDRRLTVSAC